MPELPFAPGVAPNVSGYGRMHAVSTIPAAISASHAAKRCKSATSARRDLACSTARMTQTIAIAQASAIP